MALWICAATLRSGRTADELGVGTRALRRGWGIAGGAVLLAGLFLLGGLIAGTLHDLHGERTPLWHGFIYLIWSWVQEFILQSFILVRLKAVVGNSIRASWLAAILFCIAHLPNPVLVPATFCAALVLTRLFFRYRNIYVLAVAHALVGLAVAVSIPDAITHAMKVGIAYS